MEKLTVATLLEMNESALENVKGHNKTTVKTCIALLKELPSNLEIIVRRNNATPTNAGDIAEIYVGYKLERKKTMRVEFSGMNDLIGKYKNEVKLCYSNNRPSNDIEDKGHYMVDVLEGKPRITWIDRNTLRANKQHLIKGRRGGKSYAQAVTKALGL